MQTRLLASLAAMLLSFTLCTYSASAQTANIYIGNNAQTIRGFGGMNFPRWINDLSPQLVDRAFGNGYGQIGLSILRVSVAPDPNQWALEVPTAQRAASHGAIVFSTPWSPPASMKTNGSIVRGELRPDRYGAYANHLRDFTNFMGSNGVNLYAISVQNEPDFLPEYESCGWSGSQIRTFLDNHASVIPTRVIAPETVHYKASYMSAIEGSPQVDILANHAYGGAPTRYNSGKEQWMTEHYAPNSDANSANRWPEALEAGKEIHDYLINGYNAYVWWYIRRGYGLITEDGNVSKRGFVMSHFSKFVRPGFQRVRAEAAPMAGVSVSAYRDGNTLVVVAINQNGGNRSLNLDFAGNNVSNITKWETTGTVGNNVREVSTYAGGTTLTNTLTANSITTFRGTIGSGDGGSTGQVYQLRNRGTGLFLDGYGRTSDGADCSQYANTTHPNSRWEFVDAGGGYTQLRNVGTGLFLDGMGRTENGSPVGQYANTTHPNSQWAVLPFDGPFYRLQNRNTGLFLDGYGRVSNGSECAQHASTTHPNAQWELVSSSANARAASNLQERFSSSPEIDASEAIFYPNPVREELTIRYQDDRFDRVTLYDLSGRKLISRPLPDEQYSLDLREVAKGVFIVELTGKAAALRQRIVRQ